MARTSGHGNPKWTRDEIILALDLYLICKGVIPNASDSRIAALSQELRASPVHNGKPRRDSFRNPDGVVFKLQNLRLLATGKGFSNVSAMDREVWAAYGEKLELVPTIAKEVRQVIAAFST